MIGLSLGLVLCLSGRAALGAAPKPPDDFDDRWLSVMAMAELAHAAKDGQWSDLEKWAQTLITQRLACGRLDKMQGLNDLVFVLRASRYLEIADRLEPKRNLSSFLASNRSVARLLFRAIQEVPKPEESIHALQDLWEHDEKVVLEYPNLAVAFATSGPLTHYVKQPDGATMVKSFDWFTDPKTTFRYDLKAMPYEMSRYLADTRLSIAERRWVVQQYAARPDLQSTYRDIKFDMAYYFRGAPKKITKVDYTLANILAVGGVCIDQAYFSSEICKTMGIPAAIVTGHNAAGSGHAWVSSLKMHQGGGHPTVEWDASTGRYASQKFYTGTLADPASQKKIHDSELALLGAAALLPLDRREEADTAATLAAMVAAQDGQAVANVDDLRKLAEEFNRDLAPKGKIPRANLGQIAAVRKLDSSTVENLLAEAASRNLAHRPIWDLIMELRKDGKLSAECIGRFLDILVTQTAKDYPDYSCHVLMQFIPMCDDEARREAIYLKVMEVYPVRPDLQAQVMIARADDLATHNKKDQALKVYQEVITKNGDLTEVFLTAAARVGDMFLADGRRDAAIKTYTQLFSQLRKPAVDGGYPQSAYYQLGKRLAELLTEAGQQSAAQKITDEIGPGFAPALNS